MAATIQLLFTTIAVTCINGQMRGILINGVTGTQLYDPINEPHATGGLQLGLQTGNAAPDGAAVIVGNVAYFASNGLIDPGESCKMLKNLF